MNRSQDYVGIILGDAYSGDLAAEVLFVRVQFTGERNAVSVRQHTYGREVLSISVLTHRLNGCDRPMVPIARL